MRLYLSSHRFGDSTPELRAMTEPGARAAVISNAVDFIPDEARQAFARTVFDPVAELRDWGFDAFDLDLREVFAAPDELAARMAGVGLVFAVGGNAFLLRRAMRQSRFDTLIRDHLAQDRLVYAGWSAGAVVAGPHLRGIDLMDDPQILVAGYEAEVCWDGLGLIDDCIVPHVGSDHPEAEAAARTAAYMQANAIAHIPLSDGEVLIVNGDIVAVRPRAGA
jgi:dipeptidase E